MNFESPINNTIDYMAFKKDLQNKSDIIKSNIEKLKKEINELKEQKQESVKLMNMEVYGVN
jgi:predicted translin family RNA/ssDNA-binding protein